MNERLKELAQKAKLSTANSIWLANDSELERFAAHCKVQRSSIYSALGRLQVKGFIKRFGREPALYVVTTPVETVVEEENLVIKHAHNPFRITHGLA